MVGGSVVVVVVVSRCGWGCYKGCRLCRRRRWWLYACSSYRMMMVRGQEAERNSISIFTFFFPFSSLPAISYPSISSPYSSLPYFPLSFSLFFPYTVPSSSIHHHSQSYFFPIPLISPIPILPHTHPPEPPSDPEF